MITTTAWRHQGRYFVVWITATFAAWLALVPAATSAATFIWLSVATAVVILIAVAATNSGRPTQPVAHVLYRVETSESRR